MPFETFDEVVAEVDVYFIDKWTLQLGWIQQDEQSRDFAVFNLAKRRGLDFAFHLLVRDGVSEKSAPLCFLTNVADEVHP